MWTYKLSSKNGDSFPDGRDLTQPINRQLLLTRLCKKYEFKKGNKVWIKHHKLPGVITEILQDESKVRWEMGRPHFIVVECNGVEFMCNISQIKRRMK